MHQPILKTSRLTLRPVEKTDQQKVFEGFSHPEVTKYFDLTYSTFESTNEQMEWYKNNRENGIGYAWVVCDNANSFMGIFSIHRIDKQNKRCETGYWLFPEFWNKGYAKEALNAMLDFASSQLMLHRITAEIEPENIDSILLVSNLGFEREGVFKDFEFKNGKYNDLEIWTKLFP